MNLEMFQQLILDSFASSPVLFASSPFTKCEEKGWQRLNDG